MCGRYAVASDPAVLAHEFDAADRTEGLVGPDYNVTPTKTVPIVVQRGAERTVRPVRWGLIPRWAREPSSGPPMINARAESITTKAAYADAVVRCRCLVPATGWYEWRPGDSRKQPYLCTRGDGVSLAMAAVFSAWWSSPAAEPIVSCAVVTVAAGGEFAEIHHRMPLVLPERMWADWLDPRRAEVSALLAQPEPDVLGSLELRPVSSEVNNMRNNRTELLERVQPAPEPAVQTALFES